MKRIIIYLFILLGSTCFVNQAFATHGMGGEITWKCLPNGQFKFQLKFYRDCNGISAPGSINLTTTVPGVPSIPMSQVSVTDISPTGTFSTGYPPGVSDSLQQLGYNACPTCTPGSNPGGPIGVVGEYIYESAPVTLTGTPPAAGWQFYWGECCRSNALNNIPTPGSKGFRNRAVMYPFNGLNTNPCYDSSPFFAERPSTIICTGYPFKYNPNAIDAELDSLVYSWADPLDDNGAVIPWAPGYSTNSQLPSATQNPANVGASIDANTGEITYTSFTSGYFVTVVKVTAYKCNIKVAEIFREINVVMNSNCPPTAFGTINLPPSVPPVFPNAAGVPSFYSDTIYAGDTVHFDLHASDYDFFNAGVGFNYQVVTLSATGSQFGTNFTNQNSGCLIPPCATITPSGATAANPIFISSFQLDGSVAFDWITTCAHVEGLDTNCTRIGNTFNFVFKAKDNYCPANASNFTTITITVVPPPKLEAPTIRCASVNLNGSVDLTWTRPTPLDSQNTFYSYDIYAALAAGGPWQIVDSVQTPYDDPLTYSYTHSLASLNSMFGVNAQQQSIYYQMVTRSSCRGDSVSDISNVVQTIKLNAALNGSNEAVLTWNALSTPPLSSHAGKKYMIHKEFPAGTWTLIDSTSFLTYTDTTIKFTCVGTFNYRVSLEDSSGCVSWSSLETITINNPVPVITFAPVNPAYCAYPGANTSITCTTPAISYLWNTGAVTPTINATGGTYTVTVTQNGCSATKSIVVTANTPPSPTITGNNVICAGQNTTFSAAAPGLSYVWSTGALTPTINVNTAGLYNVTVTDANGCTGTTSRNLVVNPNPVPNITGTTTFCQGQNSNLNAGGGYTSYLWNNNTATQVLNVTNSGTYTVTVTNAFNCSASTSTLVTVNPLPNPSITGTLDFCQGSNTTLDAGAGYSNYQWSGGLGANQTALINTANTFTVTVTDANGCTNNTSATTVINPNPVPSITGNNVICAGQNTTFSAAAPGLSYVWSTGAITPTINVNTAGLYSVTVTDANGCTGTTSRSLVVNPNPVPNITGTTTFCQGQNSNLNAGGGYTSYLWNNNTATQVLNVTNSGTYTVTVTNAFNCSASTSTLVTVNPLPNPSITGTLAFCQGSNTTLDAGAGYSNYQWSGGLGANQTITTSSANTYTVTVTDANGCTNNTSATTIVNPNPVPVITGTFNTCAGQTTPLDAGAGYTNYNWSTGASSQIANVGTAGPVAVTVTDINGCIGTANANVTVYVLPTATITGIDTICFGQSTNLGVSFTGTGPYTYTYFDGTSNQGPFVSGSPNINISVSPGTSTNYTLVSVENTNCVGTVSGLAAIEVTPLPSAVISGTTAICSGDNTNLTINFSGLAPFTYSYTAGAQSFGPFTTSNNSEIINVSPGATTTYGLTALITGAGCAGTTNPATATVTVNALPSVTLTGNNTICAGVSTDLTFNFNGTGPFTYTYSNGSTNIGPFTTSNNPAIVPVVPGITTTYTMVSLSDANCAGSVAGSALINVNPLPTANLSGTTSICDGTSTDLSILFTGTGPFNYSYNDGTNVYGPFVTNQNPVLVNVGPAATTTYGITTISDANCQGNGAGSALVTVIPLPTSTLTGSTEICDGSSTNLNLAFTGVPPFEYSYTDGTTVIGPGITNNFNLSIPVSPGNNTTYSSTFVSGAGCQGSTFGVVDIVVNDIPEAEAILTGNGVICNGENSEFKIEFTGVAPFTYTYSDGTNNFGPFTTSNNPEIIPVSPTSTANYSLVNMSDDNCPGVTSGLAQVVVNPLPTAATVGNPSICNGSSTSFNISFTGTGPFVYSYTDGTNNFGPFSTMNNVEPIAVSPNATTTYNVISVTDANCVGTTSGASTVTVNQIPSAILSGDATVCFGQSTPVNVAFIGVAPFTYTYSNGSSTFGPITTSNNNVNINVAPGVSTSYSLVSLNDANCPGNVSGTAAITVNPLPQPSISGDLEICDGESTTLTANSGYVSYLWSNGNQTNSVNVTTGGAYAVSVTDNNGCVNSTAVNLVVNQTPVISFTNDTSLTCDIPLINFTNNSTYPAGSQFLWDFGDNTTSESSNPSHVFLQPGTYNISLTIVTQAGCTSSDNQNVDIMFFPLAEAKFIADPTTTNVYNSKVSFNDLSQNAVSWYWDFDDGETSIERNPIHYYSEVGEYNVSLLVTNIAGCPDKYEYEIVVNPFYIPNAFTPNGDGVNDNFFDANYVLDVKSYSISIFNRWGQKVFEGSDYNDFWNGKTSNGDDAPLGVYVYVIEVVTKNGKEHRYDGTVNLIR